MSSRPRAEEGDAQNPGEAVVLEYARNVLGFSDAAHAESDPDASILFVSLLACSLLGKTMQVHLDPASRVFGMYRRRVVQEQYYCQFGLNPHYRATIHDGGLRVVGVDEAGEARIVELVEHPFFVATLFVPPLTSTAEQPHPLIIAYRNPARTPRTASIRRLRNCLKRKQTAPPGRETRFFVSLE